MKYYYPYESNKPEKKCYIMTKTGKHTYFGQASASDFTKHKTEERKNRCINRHEKIGVNQEKTQPDSGVGGYYGINQPLKKVTKTLKKDF